MQETSEPAWRPYLAQILREHPGTQQVLEEKLNVQGVTIRRWLDGERTPRRPTLRRLPDLVPQGYQERFRGLLKQAYPQLTFPSLDAQNGTLPNDEVPMVSPDTSSPRDLEELIAILRGREGEVPASFTLRLIGAASTSEESLLFWVVSSYVSQQLHILLGEEIQVLFFRCLPDPAGRIRSLYHGVSQPLDTFDFPLFCGGNQSPARALFSPTPLVLHGEHLAFDSTRSFCAVSLQRRGRIAGCLVVLSDQPHVFVNPARQMLMRWYGLLGGLAFRDEEFFSPQTIALANMPNWERQRERIRSCSFDEHFRVARHEHAEMNQQELERIVLRTLEQDLMKEGD